ncbi:MAG: hypothetical protein ABI743_13990, partial [bacterium]
DTEAEMAASNDLTDIFERVRPPSLDRPLSKADIPDWRTARFPDEEPEKPEAIPGQQPWGNVPALKGLNTR